MNEDLNLEELVDNLDCSDVTFDQETKRENNGTITCSLSFSVTDPRCDPFVIDKNSKEIEFKIIKQKSDENGADILKISIGGIEINKDNNPGLAEKLIQKMKEGSFKNTEEGMGNVLASACIITEKTQVSFSSRIGCEEVLEKYIFYKINELVKIKNKLPNETQLDIDSSEPNSPLGLPSSLIKSREDIDWKQLKEVKREYIKCYEKINEKDTLKKDISNAVKEAKQKGRRIAAVLVSCRYSSTGTNDNGHTICIAVNTDKFDNNGGLLKDSKGNPIKLTQNDCTIIDSSRAIIDTIHENPRHDNGIIEISSQLNQLIDTGNIEAYSLYPVSIQVGSKCSDYARRAYQKISSGNYENIKDLRNKSFKFASSIHNDIKNDYERILDKDIPINIRNELRNKKPIEKDYPKEERAVPLLFRQQLRRPVLSKKRRHYLPIKKTPTSEQESVVSVEHNFTLKNLKFRPKFNPYVRSSHFSPTRLSKKITNTDHGRSF